MFDTGIKIEKYNDQCSKNSLGDLELLSEYFVTQIKNVTTLPLIDQRRINLDKIGKAYFIKLHNGFVDPKYDVLDLKNFTKDQIKKRLHTSSPIKCVITNMVEETMYEIGDSKLYICKSFVDAFIKVARNTNFSLLTDYKI
jgi:uncharacterized ubiquitin-like protein YukD